MVNPIVNLVARAARLLSTMAGIFDAVIIDNLVNLTGRVGVSISTFFGLLDNKVLDGIVNQTGRGGVLLSVFSGFTDNTIVDGIVNGVAEVTGWIGAKILRPIQTGRVQNYLLVVLIAVLAILGLYLVY